MYRVSEIIQADVSTLPKRTMVSILLFGMEGMTLEENCCILNYVVDFIERKNVYTPSSTTGRGGV